ncbi:unnamed protein product [Lymnaea stagnalis]|uniref:CUB domain-containing protein n=1 Tax=Lymnaea stagnalis TaxID=6523 RepID=A0AAV2I3A9_LYMST
MMLVTGIPAWALISLMIVVLVDNVVSMCSTSPSNGSLEDFNNVRLESHEDKSKLGRLKVNSECTLEKTVRHFADITKGGTIELECGDDVIYDVTVKACKIADKKCCGLTVELLASSRYCQGKKSCNVTYEPGVIVLSDVPFSSCFGQEPSSLELSYRCLTSKTPIHDVKNTYQVIEADSGVLVVSKSSVSDPGERRFRAVIRPPPSMFDVQGVFLEVLQADINGGSHVKIDGSHTECQITDKTCFATSLNVKSFVLNVYHGNVTPSYHVKFKWYNNSTTTSDILPRHGHPCPKSLPPEPGKLLPVKKETASKDPYGLLRSHPRFPWNYKRPLAGTHQNHRTSFYHTLEPPSKGQDLLIQIVTFDLAPRDTLKIQVGNSITNINRAEDKPRTFAKCDGLVVTFTVQHGHFPTRSGFLLRYEWVLNSTPGVFNKSIIYSKKCKDDKAGATTKKPRGKNGGKPGNKPKKDKEKKKNKNSCNERKKKCPPPPEKTN